MPTKQKKSDAARRPTSALGEWLFSAPAKFTILFAAMTGLAAWLAGLLFPGPLSMKLMTWMPRIILLAIFVFLIYKIMRWTPDDKLDHKSFVILGISQSLISLAALGAAGLLIMWAQSYLPSWRMVLLTVVALALMIYSGGVGLLKIKSIFCRARMQGVSRSKLFLSLPFGFWLFLYSGFLAADAGKKNRVIESKSKLLNDLGGWITASPKNTRIAFLVIIAVASALMLPDIKAIILFAGVSLMIMAVLMLCKKLRENLGGGYANFAMALNACVIIALLCISVFAPKQATIAMERINVTEVEAGDK
jgi:hypothetical protein